MLKCGKSFSRARYVPLVFRCLVKASWIYFDDATGNKSGLGRGPDWPSVITATLFLVFMPLEGVVTYYPGDLSSRLWAKSLFIPLYKAFTSKQKVVLYI